MKAAREVIAKSTPSLTSNDIQRLVSRRETASFECKEAKGGLPDSLWESYSAFANTDGGVILLGVREMDGRLTVSGVANAKKLIKEFWDHVHNREKTSVNILFERNVYEVTFRGKPLVVIEVPRADRQDRPVYIGRDMFRGSYRRNGEGDYHCSREAVKSMIRDSCEETADACVLDELLTKDLCPATIKRYRIRFQAQKPSHVWNELPDEEFLVKIRAAKRGGDGKIHPNLAGLVCFAEHGQILDVLPNYFLDYREKLSNETRWSDRLASHDATWSGNIFDFYTMLYDRLTADVKLPFSVDVDGARIGDTPIHKSIRELLANALIHADYHGRRGIVIEKDFRKLSFSNPGVFRMSKDVAIAGGTSDARNSHIFNIFSLVEIGERSGMGLSDLFGHWKRFGFADPKITESFDPERTLVEVELNAEKEDVGQNVGQKRSYVGQKTGQNVGQKSLLSRPSAAEVPGDLPASAKQVLSALREDSTLTHRGLAVKLGFAETTIDRAFSLLIRRGLVRRVGPKKGGHWETL